MIVSQTLSNQSESSLTETNSQEALKNITNKISEFDSYLRARTYNNGSVVPYFLYVITPNREGKLVSFSSADNVNDILNTTELDSNNSQESISDVIKQHISEGLQQLYNSSSSSSVASSISGHSQVVPITSTTVDQIIKYYTQNPYKLPSAVTIINKTYTINLETDTDDDVSGISNTTNISQQPTPKKKATNDDGNSTEKLKMLLMLPQNQKLLNEKEYKQPNEGGSRSRKHRRRHKQKKNTKRRSRK
jgi:hypothetical protein